MAYRFTPFHQAPCVDKSYRTRSAYAAYSDIMRHATEGVKRALRNAVLNAFSKLRLRLFDDEVFNLLAFQFVPVITDDNVDFRNVLGDSLAYCRQPVSEPVA